MRVVYIGGPYIGDGKFLTVDRNIKIAESFAVRLAKEKVVFICPHKNTAHFQVHASELPVQFWYDFTLELFRRCDGLLLIPGWAKSKGTLLEREDAIRRDLPIFETTTVGDAGFRSCVAWARST